MFSGRRFMKVFNLTVLIVFFSYTILLSAINDKAGNSSAQFLKIQPSARAAGLGNAVTSLGGSIDSLFNNPAGMGFMNDPEVSFNYLKWFDEMNYSSLGAGLPAGSIGTFGLGYAGLTYGDIPIVSQENNGELIESGSTSANDMELLLSYGKKISRDLSVGLNMKYISQNIEEERSNGIGVDAGSMVKLLNNKMGIGFAVQNIGGKMKFMEKGYNLPMNIQLGTSYKVLDIQNHSGLVAADISQPGDDQLKINTGIEYGFYNLIFIRSGYHIGNELNKFNIGGGIQVPVKNSLVRINYAYIPNGDLGNNHMFELLFGFGLK